MVPSTGPCLWGAGPGRALVTAETPSSELCWCHPALLISFQIPVQDFHLCAVLISNIDSPGSVIDRTQTY